MQLKWIFDRSNDHFNVISKDFFFTRTISGLLISGGYGSVEVQDWFNNGQHCKVLDLPEERFSHTQVWKVEES